MDSSPAFERSSVRAIAARIGVSPATVSRVLNGKPGVAQATRDRVLEAIRGQGIRGRSTTHTLVAITVPDLDNPLYPLLAASIETRLTTHGLIALTGSRAAGNRAADRMNGMIDGGIAGLVVVGGADTDAERATLRRLHTERLPLVLVDVDPEGVPIPSIRTDEVAAARLAVQHLVELGHRRIGLASAELFRPWARRHLAGFQAACTASGLVADLHVESTATVSGGRAAAAQLIQQGATAIVTANDLMALGAFAAARDAGLWVATDLSVVGFDDTFVASVCAPPMTTLARPYEQIGALAASSLAQQLAGLGAPAIDHVLPPTLVVRESSGPAPTSSQSAAAATLMTHNS